MNTMQEFTYPLFRLPQSINKSSNYLNMHLIRLIWEPGFVAKFIKSKPPENLNEAKILFVFSLISRLI